MKPLVVNKKIGLKYEILDTYTAGAVLHGLEVKSIKAHHGSMDGSYVTLNRKDKGLRTHHEVVLRKVTIPPFQSGNTPDWYNPERDRMLLLKEKEILAIEKELNTKGVTVVPKTIGISNNKIKVELALVRGKKKYDKRQDIKKRDQNRDAQRDSKERFK